MQGMCVKLIVPRTRAGDEGTRERIQSNNSANQVYLIMVVNNNKDIIICARGGQGVLTGPHPLGTMGLPKGRMNFFAMFIGYFFILTRAFLSTQRDAEIAG